MDRRYSIRPAEPDDVELLPSVEREASSRFEDLAVELDLPPDGADDVNSVETFREALQEGRLWVAIDSTHHAPVGFALASVVDGQAHLEELDVLRSHGRRGIGSALIETVCAWAIERGDHRVTLSTFRDVLWNRPFYEKSGFAVMPPAEQSPGLVRLAEIERSKGLNTNLRVIMRRLLQ